MQPEDDDTQRLVMAASGAWQTALFLGMVTFDLGLIVSFHPTTSLNVIAVLLGVLMIISGLFHLTRVLDTAERHRVWLGIAGLLFITLGVVLIRHLDLTLAIIGLVIGLTWICQGVSRAHRQPFRRPARRARLVDLLRHSQPDRRNRGHIIADLVPDRARGADRNMVRRDGPVRDRRCLHPPARGQRREDQRDQPTGRQSYRRERAERLAGELDETPVNASLLAVLNDTEKRRAGARSMGARRQAKRDSR